MDKADAEGCCFLIVLLAAAGLLVAAFAVVLPVRVTVDEANLAHLSLAAPGNGTPASLAYDLTLVVTVHNHNWAMSVRRTAPLDAELRFRGLALALFRIAGAMDWHRIPQSTMSIDRFAMANKAAPVPALGSFAAAEFARERASGVFDLELIVTGQFKYLAHFHKRSLWVICPLRLSISTPTMPAPFARVKCF